MIYMTKQPEITQAALLYIKAYQAQPLRTSQRYIIGII
jgi:hypothetical protein